MAGFTLDKEFEVPKYSEQCNACKHFVGWHPGSKTGHCTAFPDDIPLTIWRNEFDHKRPYRGDHGIRFEPQVP